MDLLGWPRGAGIAPLLLICGMLCACGDDGLDLTGPGSDPRLLWTYTAGSYDQGLGFYYSAPALSADESVVYIGTSGPTLSLSSGGFALHAVYAPSGEANWIYTLGDLEVRSTPAVADDGDIVFVASSREPPGTPGPADWLYRLSDQGTLRWRYRIGGEQTDTAVGYSTPAIGTDGTIYVAGDSLFAIQPDGTLQWQVPLATGERLRNSPSVGLDGSVYFAFHNVPLTALDPIDGSVSWQYSISADDYCLSPPALTASGDICIGNDEGLLVNVDASGSLSWQFTLAGDLGRIGLIRSSPAVDVDGTFYVGTKLSTEISGLMALNSDGSLKWFFQPTDVPDGFPPNHGDIYSSPAIGADGTIFIGHEIGRLYALDPVDGSMKWKFETPHGITWSSPAIGSDGTIYIGDLDGNLYALDSDCGGLKTSAPWPKFRHDNQNTGRLGP
jgi:outer membrane protein assembly factor BamB